MKILLCKSYSQWQDKITGKFFFSAPWTVQAAAFMENVSRGGYTIHYLTEEDPSRESEEPEPHSTVRKEGIVTRDKDSKDCRWVRTTRRC